MHIFLMLWKMRFFSTHSILEGFIFLRIFFLVPSCWMSFIMCLLLQYQPLTWTPYWQRNSRSDVAGTKIVSRVFDKQQIKRISPMEWKKLRRQAEWMSWSSQTSGKSMNFTYSLQANSKTINHRCQCCYCFRLFIVAKYFGILTQQLLSFLFLLVISKIKVVLWQKGCFFPHWFVFSFLSC